MLIHANTLPGIPNPNQNTIINNKIKSKYLYYVHSTDVIIKLEKHLFVLKVVLLLVVLNSVF